MSDLVAMLRVSESDPVQQEAADEIERLREENARLLEALKPFAEKEYAYEGWADIARAEVWLNVRDIRAAAAAILGDVKAEAACPAPDEAP